MVKQTPKTKKKVVRAARKNANSPFFLGIVAVITFLSIIVIGVWAINTVISVNTKARLDRITAVYDALQLDSNEYPVAAREVFGEKRPYEWDKNRTHASVVQYLHGDTVTNTFEKVDAKVREAGFEYIDEPYPGSVQKQFHYKSEDGVYLRLTVSSKQYEDAVRNATLMGEDIVTVIDQFEEGTDAGPAKITVKVNLDDNNE